MALDFPSDMDLSENDEESTTEPPEPSKTAEQQRLEDAARAAPLFSSSGLVFFGKNEQVPKPDFDFCVPLWAGPW